MTTTDMSWWIRAQEIRILLSQARDVDTTALSREHYLAFLGDHIALAEELIAIYHEHLIPFIEGAAPERLDALHAYVALDQLHLEKARAARVQTIHG